MFPPDYPSNTLRGFTEQEFAQLLWRRDELARVYSQQYEVSVWVQINQFVSVSWTEWMQLDDMARRAIALEVEEIGRARQQSAREQESKLEALMAKEATAIKFPNPTGSSLGRFLS